MTPDHFRYLIIHQKDAEPPEIFPFFTRADAELYYKAAAASWTGVLLVKILRDAGVPRDQQPHEEE